MKCPCQEAEPDLQELWETEQHGEQHLTSALSNIWNALESVTDKF